MVAQQHSSGSVVVAQQYQHHSSSAMAQQHAATSDTTPLATSGLEGLIELPSEDPLLWWSSFASPDLDKCDILPLSPEARGIPKAVENLKQKEEEVTKEHPKRSNRSKRQRREGSKKVKTKKKEVVAKKNDKDGGKKLHCKVSPTRASSYWVGAFCEVQEHLKAWHFKIIILHKEFHTRGNAKA